MKEITRQGAIENNIIRFLVNQKPPCVDNMGNCIYLDSKGNRCGIGSLLSLKAITHYKNMTMISVTDLLQRSVGATKEIGHLEEGFLEDLQAVHDTAAIESLHRTIKDFRILFATKMESFIHREELPIPNALTDYLAGEEYRERTNI